MDTLTPSQRHITMSHNRAMDTTPERIVRSSLHKLGFRFRKNDRRYLGTPDIVLPHYHALIFVNGCFWHGHTCLKYKLPKTNTEYWRQKIEKNRQRDHRDIMQLIADGWRVCIVWECSITGKKRACKIADVSERISYWLEEGLDEQYIEI